MCKSCDSLNGIEIARGGGRPHVNVDAKPLTYADVFPGRVQWQTLYIVRALFPVWAKDPYASETENVRARRAA